MRIKLITVNHPKSEEMFTGEFLDTLPTDPAQALMALCEEFWHGHAQIPEEATMDMYEKYLEAHAAFEAFNDAFSLELSIPVLGHDKQENIHLVASSVSQTQAAIEKILADRTVSEARSRFRARFEGGFVYEFSDGDLSRIQQLLNELRDEVETSELFDAKHKQRVLNKVESLQRELHKKITSLDKLWGLMGEAGVALGKFGSDAKPFVDRVKEITQIAWRTQARAEELPSGTTLPLLASSDAQECEDA